VTKLLSKDHTGREIAEEKELLPIYLKGVNLASISEKYVFNIFLNGVGFF
jgi:hypothetical protein